MNCRECRHWERLDYADEYRYEIGHVENPAQWGSCGYAEPAGFAHTVTDRLAFTVDGSDYYSALVTRAEFGCVAFTKRDD